MAQWTVFTDKDFWKCYWVVAVVSMTETCLLCQLPAQRSEASNIDVWPCLMHAEISSKSLNLLRISFTVNDEIFKTFTIWYLEALFWISTTGRCSFLQIGESLSSFPSETCCVFLLLTYCHQTQLVAKCSSSCFMLVPLTFPGFSCAQVFWDMLTDQLKKTLYFSQNINFFHFIHNGTY